MGPGLRREPRLFLSGSASIRRRSSGRARRGRGLRRRCHRLGGGRRPRPRSSPWAHARRHKGAAPRRSGCSWSAVPCRIITGAPIRPIMRLGIELVVHQPAIGQRQRAQLEEAPHRGIGRIEQDARRPAGRARVRRRGRCRGSRRTPRSSTPAPRRGSNRRRRAHRRETRLRSGSRSRRHSRGNRSP